MAQARTSLRLRVSLLVSALWRSWMECLDWVSEGNTKGNLAQSAFCLVRCLCSEICYCERFAQSAGPASEKTWIRELFFSQSGCSLMSFFDFSIIWSTLGALGANFWCPKAVWATKGAPGGATPDIKSSFGIDLGVMFWLLVVGCGAYVAMWLLWLWSLCGYVAMWLWSLCGYVAMFGGDVLIWGAYVAMWLCGYVACWLLVVGCWSNIKQPIVREWKVSSNIK